MFPISFLKIRIYKVLAIKFITSLNAFFLFFSIVTTQISVGAFYFHGNFAAKSSREIIEYRTGTCSACEEREKIIKCSSETCNYKLCRACTNESLKTDITHTLEEDGLICQACKRRFSEPKKLGRFLGVKLKREKFFLIKVIEKIKKNLKRRKDRRENQLRIHRDHITDLLCTHCPQCHTAFLDFNGCFAVSCQKCSYCFCAWCLEYHNTDSNKTHNHVAHCKHKKKHSRETYYGEVEQWKIDMFKKNMKKVNSYLKTVMIADPFCYKELVQFVRRLQ